MSKMSLNPKFEKDWQCLHTENERLWAKFWFLLVKVTR